MNTEPELLNERLERLAIVLDEIMPRCALLVRDALALLQEQEEQIKNRDESLEKAREEIKWLRGMLKEQEVQGKWIYGEDETGVDGWRCSECNFFEPWFYESADDIDFIRFYNLCPSCGRKMTSYTGKSVQEGR